MLFALHVEALAVIAQTTVSRSPCENRSEARRIAAFGEQENQQFQTRKCPGFFRISGTLLSLSVVPLDSGNVLRLPALGALGHVELHCLTFLQALEAARLNSGEMHENVFAILTADETIAFGVVKPLHCSLFCH